ATSNLGYRLGLITAGAGALFIASASNWTTAYLAMAALMLVGLVAALFAPAFDTARPAPEPANAVGRPRLWSARRAVLEPLVELHGRMGPALWGVLILVALYRMPDFVSGVMASPLYKTLGFDLKEIATVTKLYGIWVGIAGGFAGGWAMARFGMFPTLLAGAFLAASSHLSFAWLSTGGPEVWRLALAISIENFCGSFAGIALIAYMSSLTTPGYAATQYALFSSLYALPGKLVAGMSGFIVSAFGYPTFFVLTSVVGIPVVLLCLAVGRTPARKAAPGEDGNRAGSVPLAQDSPGLPLKTRA
uniref:MFS transporter n=1 Tax=uncultured Methylobacterium sp. TaxID=157278 RepID=UPI0035CB8951